MSLSLLLLPRDTKKARKAPMDVNTMPNSADSMSQYVSQVESIMPPIFMPQTRVIVRMTIITVRQRDIVSAAF